MRITHGTPSTSTAGVPPRASPTAHVSLVQASCMTQSSCGTASGLWAWLLALSLSQSSAGSGQTPSTATISSPPSSPRCVSDAALAPMRTPRGLTRHAAQLRRHQADTGRALGAGERWDRRHALQHPRERVRAVGAHPEAEPANPAVAPTLVRAPADGPRVRNSHAESRRARSGALAGEGRGVSD